MTETGGEKLGKVSDVLVEGTAAHVTALVVGGGWTEDDRILPFERVRSLGGDVVVASDAGAALSAGDWQGEIADARRASGLNGKPIVTTAGTLVGTIHDVFVDPSRGTVDRVEVAAPDYAGLLVRRSLIDVEPSFRFGPDALVIPDTAGTAIERDLRKER